MKSKVTKRLFILLPLLSITLGYIIYQNLNIAESDPSVSSSHKEEKDTAVTSPQTRAVASIPSVQIPPTKKRAVSQSKKTAQWKQRVINDLKKNLSAKQADVKIQEMGEAALAVDQKQRAMQHIQIRIGMPDGHHSSYEALVHPETGRIYRTWNHTRYEYPHVLAIKVMPLKTSP